MLMAVLSVPDGRLFTVGRLPLNKPVFNTPGAEVIVVMKRPGLERWPSAVGRVKP